MKKIKLCVLAAFVIGLFQVNLFAIIYSKIEGVIKDKDSGLAIANVEVRLFQFFHPTKPIRTFKTDNAGHFIMNNIDASKGGFYLICKKEGYIPNIPQYFVNAVPVGIGLTAFDKLAGVFTLRAGENKYFNIKLERGGGLKINFFKKTESGILKFPQTIHETVPSVRILKINTPGSLIDSAIEEIEIKSLDINYNKLEYLADDMEPGDYYLKVELSRHVPKYIKNITIKKNEVTTVDYIFDFTDKTGIKGVVRKSGQPLRSVFIYLYKNGGKEAIYEDSTWLKGDYLIMLDEIGCYEIKFSYKDENGNCSKINKNVDVKKNETTILNIEF